MNATSSEQLIAPNLSMRQLLFVVSSAIACGCTTLWLGMPETWMEGGKVVDVSRAGQWLLYLSGFALGAIEACAIVIVAFRYTRQVANREGSVKPEKASLTILGWIANQFAANADGVVMVVTGLVAGFVIGVTFCFVVSIVFFTFPFPMLWDLMTEQNRP